MLEHLRKLLRPLRELISPTYTNRRREYRRYLIGDHTYGKPTVLFANSGAQLKVGRYCSIADKVTILLGGNHRTDWVTTYPFSVRWRGCSGHVGHPATKGDVIIGNDVWIGREALILSGVTIGDGAVVGAQTVVTSDVPPYAIVAGNPARLIRLRFPPDQIAALLKLRWWEWDENRIRSAMPYLLLSRIEEFARDCRWAPSPAQRRSTDVLDDERP